MQAGAVKGDSWGAAGMDGGGIQKGLEEGMYDIEPITPSNFWGLFFPLESSTWLFLAQCQFQYVLSLNLVSDCKGIHHPH